ncbi:unnamed protein product, partial [Ilex paraguariensis]
MNWCGFCVAFAIVGMLGKKMLLERLLQIEPAFSMLILDPSSDSPLFSARYPLSFVGICYLKSIVKIVWTVVLSTIFFTA